MFDGATPDFELLGVDWPNRAASRFVDAGGLRWHVQVAGRGPGLLLVHGTAASTHSWRDLLIPLASRFTVIAPDLPSHGFTTAPATRELSLTGMAGALVALLRTLDVVPRLAVGHSAGAALLARMTIDGLIAPAGIVAINGAMLPFPGLAGHVFPVLAKLIYLNPLTPRLFAFAASRSKVERLLRDTGSQIDERGIEFYTRLISSQRHVAGALGMMANWDLHGLERDFSKLAVPLLELAGEQDRAVPPSEAEKVARLVPRAEVRMLPGLGHLAHEEAPGLVIDEIVAFARRCGLEV